MESQRKGELITETRNVKNIENVKWKVIEIERGVGATKVATEKKNSRRKRNRQRQRR
jgi:hypothetical protein